tara:strand:+ start:952 stop:1326 length:375 start_codon:yes stop_codon:yes gene_type:complete
MAFKLGNEKREIKGPGNTPIFKKKLKSGVKAEANKDGSIFIDSSVKTGTTEYRKIVAHEKKHLSDMKSGKANYTDKTVTWKGETFNRDGNGNISGKLNGKVVVAPEGHKVWPWEKSAIRAEKKV